MIFFCFFYSNSREKSHLLPQFPNYPVRVKNNQDPISFHQAYGTDFDQFRSTGVTTTPRIITTTSTTTTTTTNAPLTFVAPPRIDAPVSKFYSNRRKTSFHNKLPHNHPLRQVLPPNARVVGVQPLRKIALSNRSQKPEIMTLNDFLRKYPTMEKMRSTAIVPGKLKCLRVFQ